MIKEEKEKETDLREKAGKIWFDSIRFGFTKRSVIH